MFRTFPQNNHLPAICLLVIAFMLSAAHVMIKPKKYVVTAYGAVGDGTILNTMAIQKAINLCAAGGGGTVVIPKGVFVSGAIFLKKGVDIWVEKDGVLKGSTDQADYPQVESRWEGTDMAFTAALINADGLAQVSISGLGTIDGSGDAWLLKARQNRDTTRTAVRLGRPRLMAIRNCTGVRVSGLKLHNQAVWCVHILYCKDVVLEGLYITADHNIPSSDGIDIDSSTKVRISKCFIDVNDDCISIKSGKDEDGLRVNRPSEDIMVEDCHFGYGHGGVAMGSETSGGIRNVEVRNCLVDSGNWAPIRFKSQPSRGGVVENIIYRNIRVHHTRKAFEFNMAWRMVPPIKPAAKVLPVVRNVQLINVSGDAATVGDIHGLEGSPIQQVVFKNCSITAQKGFFIEYAKGIDLTGLHLNVTEGEAVTKRNVE